MRLTAEQFSVKVRNVSALAIACVVMIHAHAIVTAETASPGLVRFCDLAFYKLTCWAVPFFFMMSGYWFAKKRKRYIDLLKKKAMTLAVPYVFFILLGLAFSIPTAALQAVKHGSSIGAYLPFTWDVLGVGVILPSGNGPLWYVRSLLILFLLAPLWAWLLRRLPILLLVLGLFGLASPPLVWNGGVPFRIGQASYFFLGMFLARYGWLEWRTKGKMLALGCSIAVCAGTLVSSHSLGLPVCGAVPYLLLVAVWVGSDALGVERWRLPWSSFVFWVYATHIILLSYILPPFRAFHASCGVVLLTLTVLVGLLAISLSVASAVCIRKFFPRFYSFVCGGR